MLGRFGRGDSRVFAARHASTFSTSSFVAAVVAASLLACSSLSTRGGSSPTVAQVDARRITLAEVDAAAAADLARIEMDRYKARRIALDQLIDDALLEQKAKSLGISKDELLKREIDDKVEEPNEDVVKQAYERWKSRGIKESPERWSNQAPYEEVAPKIRELLSEPQKAKRRADYLASLRKEAAVKVELRVPRAQVATTGGYERGPKDAPVTLVEFTDFQCPYCGRSQAAVNQVLARYDGKIRHVFMDFPQSIYPMAYPAAIAGRCANEQGRFWDYHEVLFERQKELSADNLKKWAGELGLDRDRFGQCLESKRYEAAIRQSIEIGQQAGVNGTPLFFINGVPLSGAQPAEAFQEIIDGELSRKS